MRFWIIDSLKGLAIVLVIFFHGIFDLGYFAHLAINSDSFFWVGRIGALLFIILSGLCLAICYEKKYPLSSLLKRSGLLFILGICITLVTHFFLGEGTILFGILHFLAVAPLIVYWLLPFLLTALGILSILASYLSIQVSHSYLIWLGISPPFFYSLDYFPLIPWLGIYIVGVLLGLRLYENGRQQVVLPDLSQYSVFRPFTFLGRHTLLLYMLHQPLLVGLMYLFF